MVLWRGEEKVEPRYIIGANYAAWLIVSLVIFIIVV
jgi:fumarate reductase subunit C